MKQLTIAQIEVKAQKLHKQGKNWHFHMLTPNCRLNTKSQHAFVLENSTDNQIFVAFSQKPQMKLGQKLVKLLHGDQVVQNKSSTPLAPSNPKVKQILKRARELNSQGKFWHHHMLFPDCIFNQHEGRWTIYFEDQENNRVIESVSEDEPKDNLQQIETLYYQQKTIS